MSAAPSYASLITVGAATLTTGDTSRSAPTTTVTIFTPNVTNALGGQVERIVIEPLGTTTATTVRIFRYDGAAYHLYTEIQLQVQTAAGGTALSPQTLEAVSYPNLFPILVPNGWLLKASVNDTQAAGVKIQAEGGSF